MKEASTDDERVLWSLQHCGPGRVQDIRSDYKKMSNAQLEAILRRLEFEGRVKKTCRGGKVYWEPVPC